LLWKQWYGMYLGHPKGEVLMTKILIIVPYQELQEAFDRKIASMDTEGLEIKTTHVYGTDARMIEAMDADIIVARGLTADAIAKQRPNIHVVTIPMGPSDFLEALFVCKERFPDREIGLLASSLELCDPVHVSRLIGENIHMVVANDQEAVKDSINDLYRKGCRVFVGGLTLCRACETMGYDYVHIKSGKGAVSRAVEEAIAAARSLDREKSRTNLLATLLNNAEEAMVAVNDQGEVIACNKQADNLFGVDLKTHGLEDSYPKGNWEGTSVSGVGMELLQSVAGLQLLVIQQPVEGIGVLLTFQNIERIQRIEQKIRSELNSKGLVAKYTFKDILTRNADMQVLAAKAHRYSQTDEAVLLIGETGTGKELFAQSIHNASKRAGEPFVAVNCAALPENLLESELFGYVDGAFTGARKGGKQGLFELAHKGTLFLDEIGEMPINLQAKLLRVLQEKEIRKVGGDAVVPVDVRIISATNINIREKVRNGQFRLDLFYRISLLNLYLLPLRERLDDIPILFESFVRNYCEKHDLNSPRILSAAYDVLKTYSWPGNVRELRNSAERLAILGSSPVVGPLEINELDIDSTSWNTGDSNQEMGLVSNKETYSGETLLRQYKDSGLSQEEFAKKMGMSRTTFWRRCGGKPSCDNGMKHPL